MKHFKSLALVSAALSTLVVPASAADIVRTKPLAPAPVVSVAPQDSWAGGYTGLYIGGAKNRFKADGNTDKFNKNAAKFGAYAGLNFQNDNIVYGLEGDAGYNSAKFGKATDKTASAKAGFEGSLRGRLGYDMGIFMPYVTAGVAGTQLKYSTFDKSASAFHVGWTAGAGTEAKLTSNIIARLEYRYSDFGKKNIQVTPTADILNAKFNTHEIRMGVGYKF